MLNRIAKIQHNLLLKLSGSERASPRCPLAPSWPSILSNPPSPFKQTSELLYAGPSMTSRSLLDFAEEALEKAGLKSEDLSAAMREAFSKTSISMYITPFSYDEDFEWCLQAEWITREDIPDYEAKLVRFQEGRSAFEATVSAYEKEAQAYIEMCLRDRQSEQDRIDREEFARLSAKFRKKGL